MEEEQASRMVGIEQHGGNVLQRNISGPTSGNLMTDLEDPWAKASGTQASLMNPSRVAWA